MFEIEKQRAHVNLYVIIISFTVLRAFNFIPEKNQLKHSYFEIYFEYNHMIIPRKCHHKQYRCNLTLNNPTGKKPTDLLTCVRFPRRHVFKTVSHFLSQTRAELLWHRLLAYYFLYTTLKSGHV